MSTQERAEEITVQPDVPTIANVLVPLSLSAGSEAAVGPGAELARRFGARLHLLSVGIEQAEAEVMAERAAEARADLDAEIHTRVDWDVPGGILEAADQFAPALVCMASHARGRVGELALASYTTPVVVHTRQPVMLVGPEHQPGRTLTDGPVIACVDGSAASEQVIPVAAGWARALGVGICVATVAEPALAGVDDPAYRLHGPQGDPDEYVDSLAGAWRQVGVDVTGLAIYDPIGPGQGLASYLDAAPCGLLAVTTHARSGLSRAVFGSQATAIVRHSQVPVIVVHPTPG